MIIAQKKVQANSGGLQLSKLYTNRMILQHGQSLNIHGTADAGEKVTVSIAKQHHIAKANSSGHWSITLHPLTAGGPYTLTIATKKQKFQYSEVLAGEVWLCSGQSNMEFMLKSVSTAKEDIAKAANDQIRLFDMKGRWPTNAVEWQPSVLDSVNHLQYYINPQWTECTPETAAFFSAVAYSFGKMLQDSLQIPIGLICNAIGGSPTEAWIDRKTLEDSFPAILNDWKENDIIQDWVRGRAKLNSKKSADKWQRHPYESCYLYEAGIRSLEQYPIRGVIWYQGESNAHNCEAHETLFKSLVSSWRNYWKNTEMPFYYVQLSSLNRPSWPSFRDSQRKIMSEIPLVGMAVSSDYGDSLDVHPTNKRPIGERLARWALNKTYNCDLLIPSGPLFCHADFGEKFVYITFDYGKGMRSSDGLTLRTFEVAGADGIYYPAIAEIVETASIKKTVTIDRITVKDEKTTKINQGKIKVYSDEVKNPQSIRYGWQPFTRANLVNEDGLPASTFQAKAGDV